MEIKLNKKPKSPIIIEGFPGFGLVGTIATEFLVDHLKTEQIGTIWMKEIPAMIAIHEGKAIMPISIHYNPKYNLVILHVITSSIGMEWDLTDAILQIAKQLNAKEIISLEGVGTSGEIKEPQTFFYATDLKKKKSLEKIGLKILEEGIVMGVTSSLFVKADKIPITAFFAEAQSNMPDSAAAAQIITNLDKYLGLEVDPKPLLKQAEQFEQKLTQILSKTKEAKSEQAKKQLSYVG